MRIIIAGSTGLVGRALIDQLAMQPHVTQIVTIGRRPSGQSGAKVEDLVGPVAQWPTMIEGRNVDVAISALGTTLRDAGSQDAFYALDHDAVVSFARAARAAGARQFQLVSSVGAHAASRNFYLGTKGKVETSLANVGFDRIDILRPGLLRGSRSGPVRTGERIGIALSPLTDMLTPAVLSHYRSIPAACVASALARLAGAPEPGTFIHQNDEMRAHALTQQR